MLSHVHKRRLLSSPCNFNRALLMHQLWPSLIPSFHFSCLRLCSRYLYFYIYIYLFILHPLSLTVRSLERKKNSPFFYILPLVVLIFNYSLPHLYIFFLSFSLHYHYVGFSFLIVIRIKQSVKMFLPLFLHSFTRKAK